MGMFSNFGGAIGGAARNINLPGAMAPPSTMNRPSGMMGQSPFGNQLPGNQGQGAGPSVGMMQQILPMLLQQMQQNKAGAMSGNTPQVPAPIQNQPPNTNIFAQNTMAPQEQPQEEAMKRFNVNPQSFKFGRS